ncbi:hypothetical protein CFP56_018853 [Quercus suber]|uniref:Uncharacterized protein n=1 Tax=Quercus suber TaxID=58331 RepID=A0AAW0KJX7_QUESU
MIHLGSFNGLSKKTYFGLAYSQNNEFKVLGIDSDNSEKSNLFTLNARGELPELYYRTNGTSSEDLIVFQGSLALITYNEFIEAFNIRVMKEYGNVGSWTNMVV